MARVVRGVCKTRTGYLRMTDADADGKMQKEKIADNSIITIFSIYQFY